MKEGYQVQKEVRQEPRIIGLRLQVFYIFLLLFIMLVFAMISDFTFVKFLVILLLVGAIYLGALVFENIDLDQLLKVLPKTLTNK